MEIEERRAIVDEGAAQTGPAEARESPSGEVALQVEALRRLGQVDRALELGLTALASGEGGPAALAVALVLLDQGDEGAARRLLGEVIESLPGARQVLGAVAPAPPAFAEAVDGDELDEAFGRAEAQVDQMVSADDIAERALADALGDDDAELAEAPSDDPFAPPPGPAGASAELLAPLPESAAEGAALVDAAMVPDDASSPGAPGPAWASGVGFGDADRLRILSTLETWLQNLRRRVR